ncbi:MAG: o-succinylbenzoate synthase [Weeksellaceae bacterium]|nr:o-succinylbenzoate synthase [Weeksellaceae bacterium]
MKTAKFQPYILNFKRPSGTSRGVLNIKETYFLEIFEDGKTGIGECSVFRGLSYDDVPDYEAKLEWLCHHIDEDFDFLKNELKHFPSIVLGLEQAFANLDQEKNIYFPSDFTQGKDAIKINGLIWMGNAAFMKSQIEEKLENNFSCIKLKIGVDWDSEREIIKSLRKKFPKDQMELRVDANGAFSLEKAKIVLEELAKLEIHSIEQPTKAGNWEQMAELCKSTPTPIALDEELIGILDSERKEELLNVIQPQYLILKPSLIGGFSGCDEWIALAENNDIKWWITSALESNIGLNAIAQYTYTKKNPMPQGLGTGSLFTNNFPSPLVLKGENLWFEN